MNGLAALWEQPQLNTTIFAEIVVDQVRGQCRACGQASWARAVLVGVATRQAGILRLGLRKDGSRVWPAHVCFAAHLSHP